MLQVDIPSRGLLRLGYLGLDVNGTLALDGQLTPAAYDRLAKLSKTLDLWLTSADTQGTLTELATALRAKTQRLQSGDEAARKAALVDELGAERVVAIGNGANDAAMLQRAALGIVVLGGEGLATACLTARQL